MALYTTPKMDVADQRKWEDMMAKQEQLQANLDYLAMMTDVELEEETETETESETETDEADGEEG